MVIKKNALARAYYKKEISSEKQSGYTNFGSEMTGHRNQQQASL